MFEKHKLEKVAKEHQAALAIWENEDRILNGLLDLVLGGGGPDGGGPADVPAVMKKGERSVYQLTGGGLFEPRRGPGHYQGASQGFSFPIGGTGVRYRIGQSRGTFVQGDESPTVIDSGTVVMTTQRVVFIGAKRTVEWAFSKLIAIQHYQNRPWTAIQVSNRTRVAGVTYGPTTERNFRLRLEAAIALFNQDVTDLEGQLREAIGAHDASRPREPISAIAHTTPVSAPVGSSELLGIEAALSQMGRPAPTPVLSVTQLTAEAMWCLDPAGHHEYRYWDGSRWTDAVSDHGVQTLDPV